MVTITAMENNMLNTTSMIGNPLIWKHITILNLCSYICKNHAKSNGCDTEQSKIQLN